MFDSFVQTELQNSRINLHSGDSKLYGLKLCISFWDIFIQKAVAKFVHSVEPDVKKAVSHLRAAFFFSCQVAEKRLFVRRDPQHERNFLNQAAGDSAHFLFQHPASACSLPTTSESLVELNQ